MKLIYCLQSAQEVLTISYSKLPYKITSWTDSTKIRIRFQFYCKSCRIRERKKVFVPNLWYLH